MDQNNKKSKLLSLIQEYRLVREELMFYIHLSMEEVQSMCQKVELNEKLRLLLSELPLMDKERHRLLDYTKSFLPLWMRILQCSIDVSTVVGGFMFGVSFDETKINLLLNLTYELLNPVYHKHTYVYNTA